MRLDEVLFLEVEDVLEAHAVGIARFGGAAGLRDPGLLESAVMAARSGYYTSLAELAAVYAHGIAKNHPFVDPHRHPRSSAAATCRTEREGIDDPRADDEAPGPLRATAVDLPAVGRFRYRLLMRASGVVGVVCAAMMVVATGLLVLPEEGCSGCSACGAPRPAAFNLSCSPNDLTRIVTSGPCGMPDAGLDYWPTWVDPDSGVFVGVPSTGPGVCHVELLFATGFAYSTDVTFGSTTYGNCPGCPPYAVPTSGPFTVNNPSDTCLEAGTAAGEDARE